MLKYERQWQELSEAERLFLLAVAYELPQVSGLEVRYDDVMLNTGFDREKLYSIAATLERKNLIRVDGGPLMFQLTGDAVTRSLCGAKLTDFEREERRTRGYPYRYRMKVNQDLNPPCLVEASVEVRRLNLIP